MTIAGTGVCFGLVTGAESALMAHEAKQRQVDSRIRREARIDLAKRGLVGTETEIAKWVEERNTRAVHQAEAQDSSNPPHPPPSGQQSSRA